MSGEDVMAFTSCGDRVSDRDFEFERIADSARGDELAASLMERRKEANWPVEK